METEAEKRVSVNLDVGKKLWGRWEYDEGGVSERSWLCGTIVGLGGRNKFYSRVIRWEDGQTIPWEMVKKHKHGTKWVLEDEKSLIPQKEGVGLPVNRCVYEGKMLLDHHLHLLLACFSAVKAILVLMTAIINLLRRRDERARQSQRGRQPPPSLLPLPTARARRRKSKRKRLMAGSSSKRCCSR
jgi:hypothetical protein